MPQWNKIPKSSDSTRNLFILGMQAPLPMRIGFRWCLLGVLSFFFFTLWLGSFEVFVLTRCLLQLLDPALCCLVQAPRLRVPEKRHTNTRLFESMIFWQQLLESLVLSIYQWTQSPHTAHTPFFLIPCFRWSPGILRASLCHMTVLGSFLTTAST